jgi:hypothetical protein
MQSSLVGFNGVQSVIYLITTGVQEMYSLSQGLEWQTAREEGLRIWFLSANFDEFVVCDTWTLMDVDVL